MLKKKYPKLYRLLYDEDKLQTRFFIIAGLILAIPGSYFIVSERTEKGAYQKSKFTFGIVQEIRDTHTRGGANHFITFSYKNEFNKTYTLTDHNVGHPCLDYRKNGDTIIIEYSITDNAYARIASCYWNDNLKNKYGLNKL